MIGYISQSPLELRLTQDYVYSTDIPNGKLYTHHAPVQVQQYQIWLVGKLTKLLTKEYKLTDFYNNQEKLIGQLFQVHQQNIGKYIDGQFLILIHDTEKNSFYIINNRYKATTLYYYLENGTFLFSESLTELAQALPVQRELDLQSVHYFISNGFTISDRTQLKGVKKLIPTCTISYDQEFKIEDHWDGEFTFEKRKLNNIEDELNNYESVYKDGITSFLHQYPAQELGCLLSGGHDTSFAFIQSSKSFSKPVHSFTATFPGWNFDENTYAKNISQKFGGIHHEVPFMPKDLDYMLSLIRTCEEPVVGSSLPIHLCAKEASQHVDKMIAGDGGDTIWAEYYPVAELHRYIKNIPTPGRKFLHLLSKAARNITDWERFWELEHVMMLFAEKNYYPDFMRKLCTYRHFSDDIQEQLFKPEILNQADFIPPIKEVLFTKENFHDALIEGKMLNGFYMYQSFHTYKSMEHFGLNLCLPTINKDLFQFITTLPNDWINGGSSFQRMTNNKAINRKFHKKALQRYLHPNEIYNRSFDIPWYNILKPRPELLDKLKNKLKSRELFQDQFIDKMFSEFKNQKIKDHELLELKHHGYRIFTLLSLEIWMQEYIDGRFTKSYDEKVNLEEYLS